VFTFWPIRKPTGCGPGGRVGRHKNKAGAGKCTFELHCSNPFAVNSKRDVYDDIINHTSGKTTMATGVRYVHNMGGEC